MNKLKVTIVGALAVVGAWCAQAANYLTFTAEEANSSVTVKYKSGTDVKYSTDGGSNWNACPSGTQIPLAKVGDKVSLRGNGVVTTEVKTFSMTGKIAASGDVTSLTNGQGGDATLAEGCYSFMFQGCTSLTSAPALPATTLAEGCYEYMFYGCTSLTAAPALPATTLANRCYGAMFSGCTSLTAAPALPATELADYCYATMFSGCTSLVVNKAAPGKEWKLPNATPAEKWGLGMFAGTGGNIPSPPDLNTTYYIASAPKETDCITFSADKSFGIRLNKGTSKKIPPPTVTLEYSTDQLNWQTFNVDTGYDAAQDGETYKLHIRGTGNSAFAAGLDANQAHCFANTADSAATAIACSGNIMTLLDYATVAKGEEPTMNDYAFALLFNGFAALTAAPALNAMTLAGNCYYSMFNGCTSLTAAPALNATTLTNCCYQNMFEGCTSLTAAPALPATTLADYCYSAMFVGCTSLTAAPALNATTLADACYQLMFRNCTSLTVAPALPVTTLANACYSYMFYGCTSLTAAPELPATTLAAKCYRYMFQGCTSLTAAPALPATTLAANCYQNMFNGCTSLVVNKAAPGKEWKIPATTPAKDWGLLMFKDTGGDVTGTPELNTTYYTGAKKEVVGDVTLYRYGDQVGVSVAGELTKAMADSIKDQGITNLVVGTGVTGVGAGAFEGWRSLRDVTISTNCTTIGADAFHRCQNVTNVTVQADETVAVGDYAFYRCNSLEKLSFASKPSWGETPFSFYSAIYMKDGIPEVYAIPTVEAGTAKQKLYGTNKLEGKSTEWTEIETEEQKTQFHFFKIALEM